MAELKSSVVSFLGRPHHRQSVSARLTNRLLSIGVMNKGSPAEQNQGLLMHTDVSLFRNLGLTQHSYAVPPTSRAARHTPSQCGC